MFTKKFIKKIIVLEKKIKKKIKNKKNLQIYKKNL